MSAQQGQGWAPAEHKGTQTAGERLLQASLHISWHSKRPHAAAYSITEAWPRAGLSSPQEEVPEGLLGSGSHAIALRVQRCRQRRHRLPAGESGAAVRVGGFTARVAAVPWAEQR